MRFPLVEVCFRLPCRAAICYSLSLLHVQIEIKLRLQDEGAHRLVAEALKPHLKETHKQENIFFDGSERELSSKKVIVRTRFYNTDKRCLLTIKVVISVLLSFP